MTRGADALGARDLGPVLALEVSLGDRPDDLDSIRHSDRAEALFVRISICQRGREFIEIPNHHSW